MARVLAAASAGGHWEQLMLLRAAFARHEVAFATTDPAQAKAHGIASAHVLPDCNLDTPAHAARCLFAAAWLVRTVKPDVVISTGAAPGLFCLLWGRLTGARTLWIDSVANAEQLSLSGRIARSLAHACLTQWEHLAEAGGPHYRGAVL